MDMLPGETLKGKVTIINSIGTLVNGLVKYMVTVALDPTTLPQRFGGSANLTFYTSQPYPLLAVPSAALQSDNTGEFINLLKADGSIQRIPVVSVGISGSLVTFTSTSNAIKDGDQVLLGSG